LGGFDICLTSDIRIDSGFVEKEPGIGLGNSWKYSSDIGFFNIPISSISWLPFQDSEKGWRKHSV
jgi:hypothetical protein